MIRGALPSLMTTGIADLMVNILNFLPLTNNSVLQLSRPLECCFPPQDPPPAWRLAMEYRQQDLVISLTNRIKMAILL